MRVTYGSLFTGIGGLDLGVEMALRELGIDVECAWQVEQDPFCRAVLEKHWPAVNRTITDVRFAGAASLIRVDLIVGGFPCQDVSGAGKGEGLEGARSGLWFEFKRIVGELAPSLVIVENVASGKKRWLCQVRTDLHSLGYRTRAIQVSAADVGAPHLRERVFVIAMANTCSRDIWRQSGQWGQPGRGLSASAVEGGQGILADAERDGRDERPGARGELGGVAQPADGGEMGDAMRAGWQGAERTIDQGADRRSADAGRGLVQAQSSMGGDAPRLPGRLDSHRWPAPRGAAQYEYEPPRTIESPPKGYHKDLQGEEIRAFVEGARNRRPRLKSLGNTVVPQCGRVATLTLMDWAAEGRVAA